jgi:hypothetical protein
MAILLVYFVKNATTIYHAMILPLFERAVNNTAGNLRAK